MRGFRALILVVIVVIVASLAFIYKARVKEQNEHEGPPPKLSGRELWRKNFDYTKTEGSRTNYRIMASDFAQIGDQNKYDLVNVELHVYKKEGGAYNQIKSKKAVYDENSGVLFSDGDVEIVMDVPDNDKPVPPGKLLTIQTSGVEYDTKSGRAKTDRPASFSFDRGDGKSVGAQYDPATGELVMQRDVTLHWKAQTPKQKNMEIQAGNLVYKEKESKVYLSPWSKLKRDTLNMEGGNAVVTLQQGTVKLIEADKAHGIDTDPKRKLDFAADSMRMQYDDNGFVQTITGDHNAKLISVGDTSQMTVTSNRVEMYFNPDVESELKQANAIGAGYVESKPIAKPNVPTPDTKILRSENIALFMQPGGKDIGNVETHAPGNLEFIPNRTGQRHRTVQGDQMWMTYGQHNVIESFRTVNASTRTDNPPAKGKPAPPSLTWSKELKADFEPGTGQMKTLDQVGDFRYEEGERKAKSDHGIFENPKNLITLIGPGSRVWDPTGSTVADKIVMNQQTGDTEAIGNVSSVREPDKDKKKKDDSGLLASDEPVQARAARMTSTHSNTFIRYFDKAVVWQGSNRVQGDIVEIDRENGKLLAHGNVISQLLDKNDQGSKKGSATTKTATASNKPVFTIVRAPDMVYDDHQKVSDYTGGVVLTRPDLVVTSRQLRAFLTTESGSSSSLEKAFADGGVKIVQNQPDRRRVGTSEHAEYYPADGKILLSGGDPELVDTVKGTTKGTQLTYFSVNDRLLVDGQESQPAVSNLKRKRK